jgi:hypothetical protein
MSDLELLQALFDYRVELVLWVLGSILLYGLSVNVVQRLRRTSSGRLGRCVAAVEGWPYSPWLSQVLRFVYYLGIPYLALTRGVTSPALMGMWGRDWFQPGWYGGLAFGFTLGLGALLLVLWGWRRFLLITAGSGESTPRQPYTFQRRVLAAPWGWGLIVLDVLYLEMHWAFYRSAAIRSLGDYYGVFVGFLLVLAEWGLNPRTRYDLGIARRDAETVTTMAIAFTISIVYYFTANVWLCMVAHLVMQFGLLAFVAMSRGLVDNEGKDDQDGEQRARDDRYPL